MEKNSDISIKQNLIPTIKQKIQFNYEKDNSLLILKMNNTELLYRLRSVLFGKKQGLKHTSRMNMKNMNGIRLITRYKVNCVFSID